MSLKEHEEVFAHMVVDCGVDGLAGAAVVGAAKVGKRIIKPRTSSRYAAHFEASGSHTIIEVDEATGLARVASLEESAVTKVAQEYGHQEVTQEPTRLGHNAMPLLEESQPSSSKVKTQRQNKQTNKKYQHQSLAGALLWP